MHIEKGVKNEIDSGDTVTVVAVFYHRETDCRHYLFALATYYYWLDSSRNLVGVRPLAVQDGQENRSRTGDEKMKDFLDGFIKGAKETPQAFFALVVAAGRLLASTTNSLLREYSQNHP
jgi:hypothetical protein